MFDEIEDVFESRGSLWSFFGGGDSGSAKGGKAWINRTLERNATPAIWITNEPEIDPAYLRRFDYSVRFPIPPLIVRLEIARHHLDAFAPNDDWLARIAATEAHDASADRACRQGGAHRQRRGPGPGTCARRADARPQRHFARAETGRPARNLLRTRYDLGFINTDCRCRQADCRPEAASARKLLPLRPPPVRAKASWHDKSPTKSENRCCCAGLPTCSACGSGENEKNIAGMFAEARQQDAVLVLDEADSFLADRRDAQRNWEITQVNELLTQMEAFDGIFICTTKPDAKTRPSELAPLRLQAEVRLPRSGPALDDVLAGNWPGSAASWRKPLTGKWRCANWLVLHRETLP